MEAVADAVVVEVPAAESVADAALTGRATVATTSWPASTRARPAPIAAVPPAVLPSAIAAAVALCVAATVTLAPVARAAPAAMRAVVTTVETVVAA